MDSLMKEVVCNITMSRSLFLEVNENTSDKELLNKAKEEILLPHDALSKVQQILNKVGLKLNGLDLNDWNVENCEYLAR